MVWGDKGTIILEENNEIFYFVRVALQNRMKVAVMTIITAPLPLCLLCECETVMVMKECNIVYLCET